MLWPCCWSNSHSASWVCSCKQNVILLLTVQLLYIRTIYEIIYYILYIFFQYFVCSTDFMHSPDTDWICIRTIWKSDETVSDDFVGQARSYKSHCFYRKYPCWFQKMQEDMTLLFVVSKQILTLLFVVSNQILVESAMRKVLCKTLLGKTHKNSFLL